MRSRQPLQQRLCTPHPSHPVLSLGKQACCHQRRTCSICLAEAPSKPQAAAPLAAHAPKASAPAADDDDDLLGGFSRAPAAASAQKQQPRSGPPQSTADADIEALFGGQPASQHRAGASMIDFGDEAPLEAAHVFADPGDLDVEGEPEVSLPCFCLVERLVEPVHLLSL